MSALAPLGLLAAMALLMAVGQTGDPDLFWHLKTGEQILQQRSWLATDPFSFSHQGQPWAYKDGLSDVLLHLGFAGLGYASFVLWKLLVVALWAWAFGSVLPPGQRGPVARILPVALCLGALWLVERPNLFSMALFPVVLALCERARRADEASPLRRFLPLLAVVWLWAWLHRAVLLAPVLLALLAGRLTLSRWRAAPGGPRRAWVLAAWGAALLAPLLCALTPAGPALLRTSSAVAQSALLRQLVSEWRRLPPLELLAAFPLPSLMALAAAVALHPRARPPGAEPRLDPLWHGGLLLLFTALSLDSVRWVPYLALSAALPLALVAGAWEQHLRAEGRWPRGAALLLGVLALALLWLRREPAGPLALGEARDRLPAGAVDFLRGSGLLAPAGATGLRLVHPLHFGGYFIYHLWPRARVLVDGRNDTVYPPDFLVRSIQAEHNPRAFAAMRAGDGADVVVGENLPGRVSFAFLSRDPAWALVYLDEVAAVYVKKAPGRDLPALRYVAPGGLDRAVLRALQESRGAPVPQLEAELLQVARASPRGLRVHGALVLYYHLLGPASHPRRDQALAALLSIERGLGQEHPAVRELLRRLGLPDPR